MVAIEIDNVITTHNTIPSVWNGILNYNSINNIDMQISDGWRNVVYPTYDSATQKLGDIYFDEPNNVFTYYVVELTDAEIQDRLTSQAEVDQVTSIQNVLADGVVNDAQQADDSDSLDSQALFPMWEFPFSYIIGYKCQSFTVDNELVLYKCVQAHESQDGWNPAAVPALFARVAYPDTIPVWIQPTGAQDAYALGDNVYYPTENDDIYESMVDANTWQPTVVGENIWKLIS
jgi:hypothetical protein